MICANLCPHCMIKIIIKQKEISQVCDYELIKHLWNVSKLSDHKLMQCWRPVPCHTTVTSFIDLLSTCQWWHCWQSLCRLVWQMGHGSVGRMQAVYRIRTFTHRHRKHHPTASMNIICSPFTTHMSSLHAVTPDKYECDTKDGTYAFTKSKLSIMEKLLKGGLLHPIPGFHQPWYSPS